MPDKNHNDKGMDSYVVLSQRSLDEAASHVCDDNEVFQQGNGFIYSVCDICGKQLT